MIERYLRDLARALPLLAPRRRILAEVEDHLRAAARERGEREAVAAFGAPEEVAARFAPASALRLAALAVLALLALPVLSYPLVENSLPPAPWPGDRPPDHLHWKQDKLAQLFLLGVAAGGVAAVRWRRGGRLFLGALVAATTALAAMAGLGAVLAVQWADAVPGTPSWLFTVNVVQIVLTLAVVALVARAARLSPG